MIQGKEVMYKIDDVSFRRHLFVTTRSCKLTEYYADESCMCLCYSSLLSVSVTRPRFYQCDASSLLPDMTPSYCTPSFNGFPHPLSQYMMPSSLKEHGAQEYMLHDSQ